eukprot:3227775-Rhodomonas_salina.1
MCGSDTGRAGKRFQDQHGRRRLQLGVAFALAALRCPALTLVPLLPGAPHRFGRGQEGVDGHCSRAVQKAHERLASNFLPRAAAFYGGSAAAYGGIAGAVYGGSAAHAVCLLSATLTFSVRRSAAVMKNQVSCR